MTFGVAALIAWLLTAGLGGLLVFMWVARSAPLPRARAASYGRPPPYIPRTLIAGHALLAVAGLVVWITYLLLSMDRLAWVALGVLVPVALLGTSMFIRWLGSRRMRRASRAGARTPAESRLPTLVVLCHGLIGTTTVVLVLVAAIRG
jgi:manganese efflux pump family protein